MPTVKGAGRKRYVASHAKHDQRTPLTPEYVQAAQDRAEILQELAAPMAPASTRAGRFADAAEEAGWRVERVKNTDRSRTVHSTRGEEILVVNWDAADDFASATHKTPIGRLRQVPNEEEAYLVLRPVSDSPSART